MPRIIQENHRLKLKEIPKTFEAQNSIYKLAGVIKFEGDEWPLYPNKQIGHYTVATFRGLWEEFDNFQDRSQPIKGATITLPKVLIYVKHEDGV